MTNRKATPESPLVRTSILVSQETDRALRELCAGKRPLSWEIRAALEEYVERHREQLETAA